MEVHRIEVMVIDFDSLGLQSVMDELSRSKYITPRAMSGQSVDIGEWNDESPLNYNATMKNEFMKLFYGDGQPTPIPNVQQPKKYTLEEAYDIILKIKQDMGAFDIQRKEIENAKIQGYNDGIEDSINNLKKIPRLTRAR